MAVWLAYGLIQRRRQDVIRQKLLRTPRVVRVLYGSVGFFFSAALLLGGLWWIAAQGGLTPNGLTLWGWVAVTLLGLGFVHVQVLAAASMITLIQENETSRPPRPSDPVKPAHQEPEHERQVDP